MGEQADSDLDLCLLRLATNTQWWRRGIALYQVFWSMVTTPETVRGARFDDPIEDRVMKPTVQKLVSVREVAKTAGFTYDRMLRYLQKISSELGGRLVWNVGGTGHGARWVMTWESLEQINAGWFGQMAKHERIEKLEAEVSHLSDVLSETRQVVEAQSKTIGELWRKVRKCAA